ncbi:MAG: outer membrane protein assembly factor BamE [Alphaproteobacteria bacterium]|nr:outer membrane protein assembly factor BamE [Alphaproteobacteria bacterium]
MKQVGLFLVLGLMMAACTPTQATRGNMVDPDRMAELVPGISTRQNVLQTLGSPTTVAPFDDTIWYYIGQKTEQRGVLDPEVIEQKVVVVAFTPEGTVELVEPIDASQINVPIARRKTPTGGNEVTVMQQLMGNLGRFNRPADEAAR